MSRFRHVASCAVVKSALTQSSYLLVASVLWGFCARYIQPFFGVYAYMSMLYRSISAHKRGLISVHKRVEGIGKSIRIKYGL